MSIRCQYNTYHIRLASRCRHIKMIAIFVWICFFVQELETAVKALYKKVASTDSSKLGMQDIKGAT